MCSLDVRRIGPPAGRFERRRVEKVVVDGQQALANAVGDFIEIARPQLIGYKSGGE